MLEPVFSYLMIEMIGPVPIACDMAFAERRVTTWMRRMPCDENIGKKFASGLVSAWWHTKENVFSQGKSWLTSAHLSCMFSFWARFCFSLPNFVLGQKQHSSPSWRLWWGWCRRQLLCVMPGVWKERGGFSWRKLDSICMVCSRACLAGLWQCILGACGKPPVKTNPETQHTVKICSHQNV